MKTTEPTEPTLFDRTIPDNSPGLLPDYVFRAIEHSKGLSIHELETHFTPRYFSENEVACMLYDLVNEGKVEAVPRGYPLGPLYFVKGISKH